jgi:hypothetical protein
MVEVISGNFSVWGQSQRGFRTVFDGGDKTFSVYPVNFDPLVTNPAKQTANMLQMQFGGKFVGMIFHLNVNQLPDFPVIFEFIKTTNGGTTIVDTGVQCIVQRTIQNPNATGIFYSNTDISEFTRTWEKGEFIQVHETKTANTCFQGSGVGTLHMLLDLDIPPPIPP